jgi:hypothetical protein
MLEVLLSTSLIATLTLTLGGVVESTSHTYRLYNQFQGDPASRTSQWLADRIRQADQVQIQSASSLRLTSLTLPVATNERIYLSGRNLILEANGTREVVASNVTQFAVRDPSLRGLQVQCQVVCLDNTAPSGTVTANTTITLDWLR